MSKYTGTILVTFGAKIQIFEKLVMQTANDTFLVVSKHCVIDLRCLIEYLNRKSKSQEKTSF